MGLFAFLISRVLARRPALSCGAAVVAGCALLPFARIAAQSDSPPSLADRIFVQEILILGNEKTRAEVILREMETQRGDTVSIEQLEFDRRRLESLQLFTRVEMQLLPTGQGYLLEIHVHEQWYLFPFPILFFNEHEISFRKLSYGAGVVHTNFRGLAQVLDISGWLGYNPSMFIRYQNPWMFQDARLFLSAQFALSRIRNKASDLRGENIKENRLSFGVQVGRRFTLKTSLSAGLGYTRVSLQPGGEGRTLHPSGTDHLPAFSLTFRRDYRDLLWYPLHGSFLQVSAIKTGFPGAAYIDYSRGQFDFRKYFSAGRQMVLAFRFFADVAFGRIPIYDRVFFGYEHRLRGYFSRRLEGDHLMLAGLAFRFPIIPVRYFSMNSASLGPYGQNLPFGISGAFFVDVGTLWFQKEYLAPEPAFTNGPIGFQTTPRRWLPGYGFGLNFHLPYVQIARMEYALDQKRATEIIFDIGVAF